MDTLPESFDALIARHDAEQFAFMGLTEPERARFQLRKRAEYANNPWAFLRDCIYTLDGVDTVMPVKPFPSDLQYLKFLSDLWKFEKLIAIPKSRRMVCSWNFISLFAHDTFFNKGRFNAFVSKKEDDAADLISRAEFIYHHIPDWRIPRALLPAIKNGKMSKQPPVLEFPEINSKIQGFPQGAEQMRQFTISGLLGDECAFWEQAQKFYSASKPTLDGGGRMVLISSRSPGFFKKIVYDQLDALDFSFKETPPAPMVSPMEGVEVWKNPRNKFCVVDLHYTANPAKRGKEWREAIRQSMPLRDYLMEYERSWQTFDGKPVYEDWNRGLHTVRNIAVEPGLPLLLGWDFGLTPACVVAQLVGKQLRILEEHIETDGSILKLAPRIWSHLSINYPEWMVAPDAKIFSFVDPAGFQRSQVDERTCAAAMMSSGFKKIAPGPVDWESRRQAVENWLIKLTADGAGLIVSEDACPVLIEGFGGGYRYPEKATEVEPTKIAPIKNRFSHPHDALQYLCAGASQKIRNYDHIKMTAPTYGFQS